MTFRMLLQKNANEIISNNRAAAAGNCSDITPILDNRVISVNPYLYNSVLDPQLPFEYSSDLKDNFISSYQNDSKSYTPVVRYNPK